VTSIQHVVGGEARPLESASEPLLLDVVSSAKVLGIGRTQLFKLIREGELNACHIGRRTLIAQAELEEYVGRLRQASST